MTTFAAGNLALDIFTHNLDNATALGYLKSLATGAALGLAAAYILSPTGFGHIVESGKKLAAFAENTDALVGMSLREAARWIYINPIFTVANAVWQTVVDGIKSIFGVEGSKWHLPNITVDELITSAITGPLQGLWMGPVMNMFMLGGSASEISSFKLAMSYSQGFFEKARMLFARATIADEAVWGDYLLSFHTNLAMREGASFFAKAMFEVDSCLAMAGYVTGINTALGLVTRDEKTGEKIVDPENNTFTGYRQIGNMTYWVKYVITDDNQYELVNAYAHRMKIEKE